VEPTPPPVERDPEFRRPVGLGLGLEDLDHAPEAYLRLMANPFLGCFGLVAWAALAVMLLRLASDIQGSLAPLVVMGMLLLLIPLPRLFQYHCLDCGATGRLSRWRQHLCARSAERRRAGRPRRLAGPTPPTQVVLWLWLALALGFIIPTLLSLNR
jgi:hypothetical protein